MSNNENKTAYNISYAKKNLKRIPLDVQKDKYDEIKAAADAANESVNGYIKKAIDERMKRDGFATAAPEPEKVSKQSNNFKSEPPQPAPKSAGLPSYLTPDVLAHIDRAKFANDTAYQIEIGKIVGMSHLIELADYLKQQ